MQAKERNFNVNGLDFSAQHWPVENGIPVIALHGWLDNSASFTRLASHLKGVDLLALDLAGHGQTDHRVGFRPYHLWDDISEILQIADAMGWQKFSLLGHSRGAIIATFLAGAFPERVQQLALIEGVFTEPSDPNQAPEKLAQSINKTYALQHKPLRVFTSIDSAIKARINGLFPLSLGAAEALTTRGVKAAEGGYTWSTDQLLFAPSSISLSNEQINAFIEVVAEKSKVILAEDGLLNIFPDYIDSLKNFPALDVERLAGGHHLHMEEQAKMVADIVSDFLRTTS